MSIFSALTEISSSAVSAVMGERIRIVPRKSGNYGAIDDPARLAFEIEGAVYRVLIRRVKTNESPVGRAFDRSVQMPVTTISVHNGDLAGREIATGDHLLRLEHGGLAYEVSAAEPDGAARTLLSLTVVK